MTGSNSAGKLNRRYGTVRIGEKRFEEVSNIS